MEQLKELIVLGDKSPLYQLLDIKIEEVKDGFARLSMKAKTKHMQLHGTAHGGVLATLADSAAAWAIFGKKNDGGIL